VSDHKFPPAFLDEVRARTDLAALVGRSVKLTRAGAEHKGLCPFHKERSPSFTVRPDKGFCHCFGCGWNGDAIKWMQEQQGLTFFQAVEDLADRAGVVMPGDYRRSTAPRVRREAPAPVVAAVRAEDEAARALRERRKGYDIWRAGTPLPGSAVETYLGARGIRPETVARLNLRCHPGLEYWAPPGPGGAAPILMGKFPAMLGALIGSVGPLAGRFSGLHITFLRPDGGGKLALVHPATGAALPSKKMRGEAQGAALQLVPLPEGATDLDGAEGIETAASVVQSCPDRVVWALASLGNLSGRGMGEGPPHPTARGKRLPSLAPDMEAVAFRPPPGVRRFLWWQDNDAKDPAVGEARVKCAAARYRQWGIEFLRTLPPAGMDFNDWLRAGHDQGSAA